MAVWWWKETEGAQHRLCELHLQKPWMEREDTEVQQGWCYRHPTGFSSVKSTQTAWRGSLKLEKTSRIIKPNL